MNVIVSKKDLTFNNDLRDNFYGKNSMNVEDIYRKTGFDENQLVFFRFTKNQKTLQDAPLCGLSLKAAGSMRFRWEEDNPVRNDFTSRIEAACGKKFVPVQLDHTKIVFDVENGKETTGQIGDGIITKNKNLIPAITVADCVPIYFYDSVSGAFGIVHSGWKGTGIIDEAIKIACKKYGSCLENIYIVVGPHIESCCYIVDEQRADYFVKNFCAACVTPLEPDGKCYCGGRGLPVVWNNGNGKLYRLSLEKANLAVLKRSGIPMENINLIKDCTCCFEKYGSNRRQTASGEEFCVQTAFVV